MDREVHLAHGHGADDEEWEYPLWRRHLFMGIGSFTLGAVLLFGYLVLTPHGPHRGLLMVVDAAGVRVLVGAVRSRGDPLAPDEMARPVLFRLVADDPDADRGGCPPGRWGGESDHSPARPTRAVRRARLSVAHRGCTGDRGRGLLRGRRRHRCGGQSVEGGDVGGVTGPGWRHRCHGRRQPHGAGPQQTATDGSAAQAGHPRRPHRMPHVPGVSGRAGIRGGSAPVATAGPSAS